MALFVGGYCEEHYDDVTQKDYIDDVLQYIAECVGINELTETHGERDRGNINDGQRHRENVPYLPVHVFFIDQEFLPDD